MRLSYLRSPSGPVAIPAAKRGPDGHREPDAGERVLVRRVDDRDDDADDQPVRVKQWAAGASRVDRGVELDESRVAAVIGVRGPVQARDDTGGHAVGQAERIADGEDLFSHDGTTTESRRH